MKEIGLFLFWWILYGCFFSRRCLYCRRKFYSSRFHYVCKDCHKLGIDELIKDGPYGKCIYVLVSEE